MEKDPWFGLSVIEVTIYQLVAALVNQHAHMISVLYVFVVFLIVVAPSHYSKVEDLLFFVALFLICFARVAYFSDMSVWAVRCSMRNGAQIQIELYRVWERC